MHTAPATNVSHTNVSSPDPSTSTQFSGKAASSDKAAPSKFQDVYQNFTAAQQNGSDDQTAAKNDPLKKKIIPGQAVASITVTTPAIPNNNVASISILQFSASLPLAAQSTGGAKQAETSPAPAAQDTGASNAKVTATSSSSVAGLNTVEATALSATTQTTSSPTKSEQIATTADTTTANADAPLAARKSEAKATDSIVPPTSTDTALTLPAPSPTTANLPAKSDHTEAAKPAIQPTDFNARQAPGATDWIPQASESLRLPQQQTADANSSSGSSGGSGSSGSFAGSGTLGNSSSSGSSASIPLANQAPARPLSLSADNLAFSLQVSSTSGSSTNQPSVGNIPITLRVADAKSSAPEAQTPAASLPTSTVSDAQPITNAFIHSSPVGEESKIPSVLPTVANAAPSRPLPNIVTAPGESKNLGSSDSAPRQQRDLTAPNSPQRDTASATKSETTARPEVSTSAQASSAMPLNSAPDTTNHTTQTPVTSWQAGTASLDAQGSFSTAGRPAPLTPVIDAPIQDIHALTADAPKTTAPSEILLHLDSGQNTTAVRLVDRGGSINISVHAADQETRNTLRANLNDLSSQLNAQGLKTEIRTASSQGSSENRPDQGTQDQRSGGQHSQPQGERQSSRDRRASNLWLDELQEQTSATTANPGGNQ